jgi:hypothetical protein
MLGKNEVPNNAELQSYLRDGGQNLDPHKLAWCAAFVSASLQRAGLPVPTQVVKDSSFGAGAYAPNYLTYGSAVDPKSIQAGDILVANNGSHVGFAEGPIRQGRNGPEVQLLAGNERDASGQYSPGSYTNPKTGAVANRAQVGQVGERWVPLSEFSARRYQQPADSSQAVTPATQPTPGTTLNSAPAQGSSVLDTMRQNIGQYESGNNYSILGKRTNTGDQAVGRYQVMKSNIPSWTQKWLGHSLTPEQFRADPQAQDAVFNGEFGSYLKSYSPADASSKWFTGQPLAQGANKRDILGTTGARYVEATTKGIDNPYAMGTTVNTTAPAAPPAAPGALPAAPATQTAEKGLPGFQAGSAGEKMTQEGLKTLGMGGSPASAPQPMQLAPPQPAQAMGGPMMLGAGGQNTQPRLAAMNALAQQGYMVQPSLAAFTPSMPGTTLNSPSQLQQMALQAGQLKSPYDTYANPAYYGSA